MQPQWIYWHNKQEKYENKQIQNYNYENASSEQIRIKYKWYEDTN